MTTTIYDHLSIAMWSFIIVNTTANAKTVCRVTVLGAYLAHCFSRLQPRIHILLPLVLPSSWVGYLLLEGVVSHSSVLATIVKEKIILLLWETIHFKWNLNSNTLPILSCRRCGNITKFTLKLSPKEWSKHKNPAARTALAYNMLSIDFQQNLFEVQTSSIDTRLLSFETRQLCNQNHVSYAWK